MIKAMETTNDLDRAEHYLSLDADQRQLYRRLLACEDQQLYDWFLKKQPAADPELAAMIELILSYNRPA